MHGKLCRHCNAKPANRPRGLCHRCYDAPGVRASYPTNDKFYHLELGNFYGPGKTPTPTSAPPSTAAKIAVMAARAERGERLWHPADAGWGELPGWPG